MNAPVAPGRILVDQAQYQPPDRGECPWSTRVLGPAALRVAIREQAPVPSEHGIGADQQLKSPQCGERVRHGEIGEADQHSSTIIVLGWPRHAGNRQSCVAVTRPAEHLALTCTDDKFGTRNVARTVARAEDPLRCGLIDGDKLARLIEAAGADTADQELR